MEQQITHQRLVERAMVKLIPIRLEAAVTGTIANMVEQAGVRAALLNAVQAAMTRAQELASAHE